MQIKYVQNKAKMVLTLPLLAGPKKVKSKITFTPNSICELSDEEGKKLLELDSFNFQEVKNEKEKEKIETSLLELSEEPKKRGRPKKIDDDSINS